ncbi:hypothetical protein CSC94_11735 [Zhengella mangrovi]|uniref:Flavin reductase like domain-containing protein n=1 Tax=Zhengella mangrovi TaxID=1982044 RepID=A0A2G1QMP6_9HYPH|nr:flavin reductase family protein [Zhengella mangrovi]PHP66772.1 hypothetical protein CSC94_11735 [Zhengella mangrovi]
MEFDSFYPEALDRTIQSKLMNGIVVPRPIAWVSTTGSAGLNLAPFSYFNVVAVEPPVVMFSISIPVADRTGTVKDTLQNLREVPEFVLHLVDQELALQMNETSAEHGRGTNEFEAAGLTPIPSSRVRPPRIGEAGLHLECALMEILEIGKVPYHMVLGEVIAIHARKSIVDERYRVDQDLHRPIGRLGGASQYATTKDRFTIMGSHIKTG